MKKNEYQCALCKNVYQKGWSEEETLKEMREIWGNIPKEERAVICDDCFNIRTLDEVKKMGDEYKNNL